MCQSLFFKKVAGLVTFVKKETLALEFSYEFCDIFLYFYHLKGVPVWK